MNDRYVLTSPARLRPDSLPATRVFVRLRNFAVDARIGIHLQERASAQPLLIQADVEIEPPSEDRIEETLDYPHIAELTVNLTREHIGLIETFARRLASALLSQPGVLGVDVTVEKPNAVPGGMAGTQVQMIPCRSPDRARAQN